MPPSVPQSNHAKPPPSKLAEELEQQKNDAELMISNDGGGLYDDDDSDEDMMYEETYGGHDGGYGPFGRRKRAESPVREDPDDLLTTQTMGAVALLLPSLTRP